MIGFRISAISISLCAFVLAACGSEQPDEAVEESIDPGAPVTIYSGGVIYTGLKDMPTVEAVAVSEGVVSATGTREIVIEAANGPVTEIDLAGAAMYPGFTDSHAHFLGIGMRELTLNLEGTDSVAALIERIEKVVSEAEPGAVIYGRGWIETGWPEDRMPNREDLDAVAPENPVILTRADGHAMVVNSPALKAAGIDADTADPDGGRIERDADGRATGILIDRAQG
ncbi:MAG: amidohydrolase family protein, partial [Marinicaulis sp.]|nr:amidohydrolase family protein [Marinicaulis sp.]